MPSASLFNKPASSRSISLPINAQPPSLSPHELLVVPPTCPTPAPAAPPTIVVANIDATAALPPRTPTLLDVATPNLPPSPRAAPQPSSAVPHVAQQLAPVLDENWQISDTATSMRQTIVDSGSLLVDLNDMEFKFTTDSHDMPTDRNARSSLTKTHYGKFDDEDDQDSNDSTDNDNNDNNDNNNDDYLRLSPVVRSMSNLLVGVPTKMYRATICFTANDGIQWLARTQCQGDYQAAHTLATRLLYHNFIKPLTDASDVGDDDNHASTTNTAAVTTDTCGSTYNNSPEQLYCFELAESPVPTRPPTPPQAAPQAPSTSTSTNKALTSSTAAISAVLPGAASLSGDYKADDSAWSEVLEVMTQGDVEAIRAKGGALLRSVRNRHGLSLLHYAVNQCWFDMVVLLVGEGVDLNAKDKNNWTPLHCACDQAVTQPDPYVALEIVEYLLLHGAHILSLTVDNTIPLHYLVRMPRYVQSKSEQERARTRERARTC
jgi:hypothetical protein